MSNPYFFNIYFGVPGSGKTTYAAYLSKRFLKKGLPVYSNVPIKGAFEIDPINDLGTYYIEPHSLIIIDEAGLDYNNRKFKTFSDANNYFFKYHRHHKCSIAVFSQSYCDMDKKLRLLAVNLFIVKKSLLPKFILIEKIGKRIGINDFTKDICDEYFFKPWYLRGKQRVFCPPLWKMFDSYTVRDLPVKEFKRY